MLSKTLKLQIVKPINSSRGEFKSTLKVLSYNFCRICNRVIQLCYDYENQRRAYREVSGTYPKDIVMYGMRFNDWVYLKVLDEFLVLSGDIVNQAVQYALQRWQADKEAVYSLRKSIPSFDLGTPISLHNKAYTLAHAGGIWTISADLIPSNPEGQYSYTWLINPDNTSAEILESLTSGLYRQGTMQLQQDRGNWYCQINYNTEPMVGVDPGKKAAV